MKPPPPLHTTKPTREDELTTNQDARLTIPTGGPANVEDTSVTNNRAQPLVDVGTGGSLEEPQDETPTTKPATQQAVDLVIVTDRRSEDTQDRTSPSKAAEDQTMNPVMSPGTCTKGNLIFHNVTGRPTSFHWFIDEKELSVTNKNTAMGNLNQVQKRPRSPGVADVPGPLKKKKTTLVRTVDEASMDEPPVPAPKGSRKRKPTSPPTVEESDVEEVPAPHLDLGLTADGKPRKRRPKVNKRPDRKWVQVNKDERELLRNVRVSFSFFS